MKVRVGAVAMLACALVVAGTNHANAELLSNPGFETAPFVADGFGVGKWAPFAGGDMNTSEIGSTTPRTGANAAELTIVSDEGFAGFFQDVPATAGADIDWSVWAMDVGGDNGAGVEMRIEYRDSVANTEISRTANLVPASLSASVYEQVVVSDVVPAGADTARVVFAIQSFGGPFPGSVFVDDAMVNTIPEPASIAMIGLAGLALAARRRS